MKFRPCIDIHGGRVKQIVGSSLRDSGEVTENFVSQQDSAFYADMYYNDGLSGGHVIMLGPGNEDAARKALARHPGTLQIGGGIGPDNALRWLEAGAAQVIVTSCLFTDNELDFAKLEQIASIVPPEKLVLDLSCRPLDGEYRVAINRWQTICRLKVNKDTMASLARYCSEFLIHAVAVEGKRSGIDEELVTKLADWSPVPVTYAGGIASLEDIELIRRAGQNRIDFTVGSALDIFGGKLPYKTIAAFK